MTRKIEIAPGVSVVLIEDQKQVIVTIGASPSVQWETLRLHHLRLFVLISVPIPDGILREN